MELTTIIKGVKPAARFDKAPIFRRIDNEQIAKITEHSLVRLLDNRTKMQSFAGSLGRAVLKPFDDVKELEHTAKRNYVACGLAIVKGLINEGIIYKKLEDEVIGVDDNGNKIYKLVKKFGRSFKVRHWNLYVSKKYVSYVEDLMWKTPIDLNYKSFPSISKPSTRKGFYCPEGGALVANLNRKYLKKFSKRSLPIVYKHVNRLQQTPWNVNSDVLKAIQDNVDKDKFTFKKKIEQLNKLVDAGVLSDEDRKDAITGWKRDLNCTLSLAAQLEEKAFYFYWYLDTRGRYYCASSYLTPQGSKLSKSLLMMKNKQRIGKDGYKALLIHLANTAGQDKLTIKGRIKWSLTHLEDALFVGSDPSGTYTYWSEMDDSTGFLAACIELYKAHQLENKYDYESGLLISFDATTSGLQIMAMITRCEEVGKLTNLTDSSIVGDIYKHIADQIWDDLSPYWKALREDRRLCVKRQIMTIFYSAGVDCISQACYSDFRSELPGLTEDLCKELGEAVMKGCRVHLPGAFKVMKLFMHIGSSLAEKQKNIYLKGISNNFPFIQSCTIPEMSTIEYKNGDDRIQFSYISKEGAKIDKLKTMTSSSPNVIHHLDSQIVAEVLKMVEYDMIPTHDCFSAVPANAMDLFGNIRLAFYNLFGKNDVLQQICDQFKVKNTIKYGSLNTTSCLRNQFCFS